ncbi:MAG: hypothetical protein M3N18_06830 [Actinomycetota bacterium]|nr:hypothetical protein [Actinomycetota bacterium]
MDGKRHLRPGVTGAAAAVLAGEEARVGRTEVLWPRNSSPARRHCRSSASPRRPGCLPGSSPEGTGWRPAKVGTRELASLLLGSLRDAGCVALDPLPGVGPEPANRLLCLGRESFLDLLPDE